MQRSLEVVPEQVSADLRDGFPTLPEKGPSPINGTNETVAGLSIDDAAREQRRRVNVLKFSESMDCVWNVDSSGKLDAVAFAGKEDGTRSISNEILSAKNMDPNLWAFLPDDLLDRVLACLPFWNVLRLRSVSQKWNHGLTSAEFLDNRSRSSSREILFIMFADFLRQNAVATYNPTLNKWHLIPLSLFKPCKPPNYFIILATAGGLICLEDNAWPNRSLFVSNPINRSYRKLPPMLYMKRPYVVGMMMETDGVGYRVLVAEDGESLNSQYYDSRSDCWKMNSTLNRRVAMIAGITSIEGFFYCLTFGPIGLVAYNIKKATWHDLQIKMLSSVVAPHVIEHNRQLAVVGGVEECGSLTSIRIWQLNLSSQECTEVEKMPDHLFHKLMSSSRDHFFCVGEAGLICFNAGSNSEILMYSMAEKKWWWLPACPLLFSLKRHSGYAFKSAGFSIEPKFGVKA